MPKLQPPPVSLLDTYRGDEFAPVYAAVVTVRGGEAGHGRASGIASSPDGLNLEFRLPPEMGGAGDGANPEQLFAAAYGACFHGILRLLSIKHALELPELTVDVSVAFGRDPDDGRYCLIADLLVRMPGVDRTLAQQLVRASERICPYAKLVRQGGSGSVRVET